MMRFLSTLIALCLFISSSIVASSTPLTITPLATPKFALPLNNTVRVKYKLTNQSSNQYMFAMDPIAGITQLPSLLGGCGNPVVLSGHTSCIITLLINGAQFTELPVSTLPIFCQNGSPFACFRPARKDTLQITQAPATTNATLVVTDSPLTLITNGDSGKLTVTNTSLDIAATSITANLAGTALDGHVTEIGNTCSSLSPQASCTLTYLPGNTVVPMTDFIIQGSNTNSIIAAMQVSDIPPPPIPTLVSPSSGPASGGTGVIVTAEDLTGATSISFGGVTTTLNIVNSTTVTAVAPAHAEGAVDVVVTTPNGDVTAQQGYTYLATAVGQRASGGTIACLDDTDQDYLIAAVTDNGVDFVWGGFGTTTNASSTTDGATNTAIIIQILGDNGGTPYAAQLCADYEVDSQGNTPCQSGNICYTDWFLPAVLQLQCIYGNRDAVGGFSTTDHYWSSTENDSFEAWGTYLTIKDSPQRVRCVRSFAP
jgi:hypothetical protein